MIFENGRDFDATVAVGVRLPILASLAAEGSVLVDGEYVCMADISCAKRELDDCTRQYVYEIQLPAWPSEADERAAALNLFLCNSKEFCLEYYYRDLDLLPGDDDEVMCHAEENKLLCLCDRSVIALGLYGIDFEYFGLNYCDEWRDYEC
jgi:hypothetical protein